MKRREQRIFGNVDVSFSKAQQETQQQLEQTKSVEMVKRLIQMRKEMNSMSMAIHGKDRMDIMPQGFYAENKKLVEHFGKIEQAALQSSFTDVVLRTDIKTEKKKPEEIVVSLESSISDMNGIEAGLADAQEDAKDGFLERRENNMKRMRKLLSSEKKREQLQKTNGEILEQLDALEQTLQDVHHLVKILNFYDNHDEFQEELGKKLAAVSFPFDRENSTYQDLQNHYDILTTPEYRPPEYERAREIFGDQFIGMEEIEELFVDADDDQKIKFTIEQKIRAYEKLKTFLDEEDVKMFMDAISKERGRGLEANLKKNWMLVIDHPDITLTKMFDIMDSETKQNKLALAWKARGFFGEGDGKSLGSKFLDESMTPEVRWRIAKVGIDIGTAWDQHSVQHQMYNAKNNARYFESSRLRRRTLAESVYDAMIFFNKKMRPTYGKGLRLGKYRERTSTYYNDDSSKKAFVLKVAGRRLSFQTGITEHETYPEIQYYGLQVSDGAGGSYTSRATYSSPDGIGLTRVSE